MSLKILNKSLRHLEFLEFVLKVRLTRVVGRGSVVQVVFKGLLHAFKAFPRAYEIPILLLLLVAKVRHLRLVLLKV